MVPREEYVGWIGLYGMCPTLHQQECSLTVSRGHYLVVPASFVNFPRNGLNQGVGFSPWEVNSKVSLIKLVIHVSFDVANYSVEPQRCRAYTIERW